MLLSLPLRFQLVISRMHFEGSRKLDIFLALNILNRPLLQIVSEVLHLILSKIRLRYGANSRLRLRIQPIKLHSRSPISTASSLRLQLMECKFLLFCALDCSDSIIIELDFLHARFLIPEGALSTNLLISSRSSIPSLHKRNADLNTRQAIWTALSRS